MRQFWPSLILLTFSLQPSLARAGDMNGSAAMSVAQGGLGAGVAYLGYQQGQASCAAIVAACTPPATAACPAAKAADQAKLAQGTMCWQSYLNLASGLMMSLQALSNLGGTKAATDGGGGGVTPFTWDPSQPIADLPGMDGLCNGADAPAALCQPGGLDTALQDADQFRDLAKNGNLGASVEDAEKSIGAAQQAIADFKAAAAAGFSSDGLGGDSGGTMMASVAHSNKEDPNAGNVSFEINPADDGSNDGRLKRAGPDGTRFGPVSWNGSLDMIDSETGKSLTIWQRATRRYQGDAKGTRAFTMARIEWIRKEAQKNRAHELPNKMANRLAPASIKATTRPVSAPVVK